MEGMLLLCCSLQAIVLMPWLQNFCAHWERSQKCNVVHRLYVHTKTGFSCQEKVVNFLASK